MINRILALAGYRLSRASTIPTLQCEVDELRRTSSEVRAYGHRVRYDVMDLGMNLAGFEGEPTGEAAFIARTVKPGQTVIDVGANIGVLTLLMAGAVGPAGRVIAFEPGPRSFRLLKHNTESNGFQNIVAEHCAVGASSGEAELQICMTGESDNRMDHVAATWENVCKIKTRVVSLDDYLQGQHVDLIKIDAQGSEFKILQGLRKTVAANQSMIITAEFSPHWLKAAGVSPGEWFDLVSDLGLRAYNITERGELESVDRRWLMSEVGGVERAQVNIALSTT